MSDSISEKAFIAIIIGVVAAGLVFLIVGLIVHFAVKDNMITYVVSLFAICMGAIMAGIALIVLAVLLIARAVRKSKKR